MPSCRAHGSILNNSGQLSVSQVCVHPLTELAPHGSILNNSGQLSISQVCVRHLAEPAAVHGALVDLLGGDDREGDRVREGDASEGGDEDHGAGQRRALAGLVHQRSGPHGHHHIPLLHRAQGGRWLWVCVHVWVFVCGFGFVCVFTLTIGEVTLGCWQSHANVEVVRISGSVMMALFSKLGLFFIIYGFG